MMNLERIFSTVAHSRLAEDLRDEEIAILANLMTLQHYQINGAPLSLVSSDLQDALMIMMHGEIDISATVNHEHVALHLSAPGDLARVVSFVGGNVSIEASITVLCDSSVLLLKRSALEGLLNTHPLIAYHVMRNLVRHMHGVARRGQTEKEEISNYLYCIHGRY
jgi:CRP-like cAMP-binding protein